MLNTIRQNKDIDNKIKNVDKVLMINPKDPESRSILYFIEQAQKQLLLPNVSNKLGVKDITRPGLIKDLILGDFLRHMIIDDKTGSSACELMQHDIRYQYYHAIENNLCQIHDAKDTLRFKNNTAFFFAFYSKDNPLSLKRLYKCDRDVFLLELASDIIKKQAGDSEKKVHIGFDENWCGIHATREYDIDTVFNE